MVNTKDRNGALPRRHRWVEPSIAILCLVITGMLWQFLRISEHAHIRKMTGLVAEAVQADLDADFTGRLSSQRQMARLWEVDVNPTPVQVRSHAQLYVDHNPGCQAVDWIDPSGRVHRIMAAGVSGDGQTSAAPVPPSLQEAMQQAIIRRDATMAVISGERAVPLLVSVMPAYRNATLLGFLTITCDLKSSLDSILEDTKGLGYAMAVSLGKGGNQPIYRLPADMREAESEWGQVIDLSWPMSLRVRVWPRPAMLANLQSHVPEAALFVGILLSILLVLSVHFAQTARVESWRVDLFNQELSSEIAERRMTEAALKASQQRLSGILEISADAVVSVDESQRITLFNEGAERIFGYRAEEVLGQPLQMLLPPPVRDRHHELVEEFGQGTSPTMSMCSRGNIRGVRKDGTEFPAEATISKLQLPEGKLYTAILRDITDRVKTERELLRSREELEVRIQERTAELATANTALQAEIAVRSKTEQSLRKSEGRLQAILDNSAAAIFMKDPEGRYILINRCFEAVCQVPRAQIVGRTAHEIFTPERAAALHAHDQQVLETRAPIEFEELIEHDGEVHTYLAVKFPICDSHGIPYALCGISQDITKRKQAEDSLRELSAHLLRLQDEERRRIARELHDSTGSHLFALSIHLAKAQGLCREQNGELRKALEDGMESVENFSSEIRTLSYLLHPPLLDDLGLVPALNSYVNGFAQRSGIRAKFVTLAELGRLPRATELTIFRIVQEALTNIHHHSGSPTANVGISRAEAGVVVTIRDEGRGFSPEILAGTGTGGVGLAGMRERVRQLGGTLEIRSGDGGTIIRATLPDIEANNNAAGAGA